MGDEADAQALWDEVAAERESESAAPESVTETTKAADADPPQAVVEEPKSEEPKPAEPVVAAEEPAKPDPNADLVARLEKLEGRTRNVEGHIGGLTSEQKRIVERIEASQKAMAQVEEAPTAAQVQDAASDPEKWANLRQEFPEWAEATESFVDSKLKSLRPIDLDENKINDLISQQVGKVRGEIVDTALNAVFPGWKQEINKPEFADWFKAQSEDVRRLANSEDVADAVSMLRAWDAHKQSGAQREAAKISEQRKDKLQQAAAAPGKTGQRPPVQKSPDDMSAEELWEYERIQREKKRASG